MERSLDPYGAESKDSFVEEITHLVQSFHMHVDASVLVLCKPKKDWKSRQHIRN